jgi:hypothetical protein
MIKTSVIGWVLIGRAASLRHLHLLIKSSLTGCFDLDYQLPVIQKNGPQHGACGQATDNLSWRKPRGVNCYVWVLWGFRWQVGGWLRNIQHMGN